MVRAAVLELRRREVDDALARAVGQLVDEARDVLIGVAEAHAAPYPRLEVRRAARQVERDDALALVPDVDHAVEFIVAALDGIAGEQVVPKRLEFGERLFDRLGRREFFYHRPRVRLVDDARFLPFILFV